MNKIIIHFHQKYSNRIEVNGDTTLNTLFYADDQILLQRALYTSNNTTEQFWIRMSSLKSTVMVFKQHVPIRSKLVTGNTTGTWKYTYTHGMKNIHTKNTI